MSEKPRSAPGAGTVEQLGPKRFSARVTMADGTRPRLGVYPTEEQARAVLDAALVKLASAHMAPVGGVTLRAYGERWLDRRELDGVRDVKNDRGIWKRHIEPSSFIDDPIVAVEKRDVREWINQVRRKRAAHVNLGDRKRERLSRSRSLNILNLLRACFRDAISVDEILTENPAAGIELPLEDRVDDEWTFLEPAEQRALCESLKDPERTLVEVAMGTGLRAGELVALRKVDVHLEGAEPFIHVRYGKPLAAPRYGQLPKNHKKRDVPLFGIALEAMRRWLEDGGLEKFTTVNRRGRVFPGPRGGDRSNDHAFHRDHRKWPKALKAAGVERNVRWHDLRHTCASSLVSGWWGRRWSLEEVCALLGHSDITVTQRYAHLGASALKAAAAATGGVTMPSTLRPRIAVSTSPNPALLAAPPIRIERTTFGLGNRPTPEQYLDSYGPKGRGVDAARLLELIAAKDPTVMALAERLADGVLELAVLAQAVKAGGPLAVRAARQLAEALLLFDEAQPGAGSEAVGALS